MRLIPLGEQHQINRATFKDTATEEWRTAKDAYADAHTRIDALYGLLHRPGQVKVYGQVTGALHTAKLLRADVDRIIDALTEIVDAGKRVES